MTDIPIVTDMRELPKTYWGYTSFDKMPNPKRIEALLEKYRVEWELEPGRVSFYAAPSGKLSYYVIEVDEREEK